MEIIKQGDKEKACKKKLGIRRFVCTDCDCIWTATNEEYTLGSQLDPGPYMDCPCCGKKFVSALQGNKKDLALYIGSL